MDLFIFTGKCKRLHSQTFASLPLLWFRCHYTARQAHHDTPDDQNGSADPSHEKGGAKRVPAENPESQTKSQTAGAKRGGGSGVTSPRSLSSHQPCDGQSSHHAKAFVRVRHKAKTLYDQVGKGGHSSDATPT